MDTLPNGPLAALFVLSIYAKSLLNMNTSSLACLAKFSYTNLKLGLQMQKMIH